MNYENHRKRVWEASFIAASIFGEIFVSTSTHFLVSEISMSNEGGTPSELQMLLRVSIGIFGFSHRSIAERYVKLNPLWVLICSSVCFRNFRSTRIFEPIAFPIGSG